MRFKQVWNHFWLCIDWHGRIYTVSILILAVVGATLAHQVASIWVQVSGVYLWVITALVFVMFICTLSLAASKLTPRQRGGVRMFATATVHYLLAEQSGPQVLMEYDWREQRGDSVSKPLMLSNVGDEA